jgi:pyridoxine 5-phosphate synthase
MRLYVNIDHVATVRQARRTDEPDPVAAARLAEEAGADGITAHLREDRRHIQDDDVVRLAEGVRTVLNLELATSPDIVALACRLRPFQATIVPERREEVTTEGGLDVVLNSVQLKPAVRSIQDGGIGVSLFVDPDLEQVKESHKLDAQAIEINTASYADAPDDRAREAALRKTVDAARLAKRLGLSVHAGHGLTYHNVRALAAISEISELNIGHSIVSRALLVGMERAVREMLDAMGAR